MRILFLTSRFPFPLDKGDKLRAFYQIVELSKRHEIILVSVSDLKIESAHFDALKPFCRKIILHKIGKVTQLRNIARALFNGKPFQVEYFFSRKLKETIHRLIEEEKPDAIFCQLVRMAEYVNDVKHIPKMLDYQDAFSKGYERMAERSVFLKRILLTLEARRLNKYECRVFDNFQHKIIISEQDRKLISHPNNSKIVVVPNGVDFEYWKPSTSSDEEKKYDLLFSGNMNYPPNIESALFIAGEVMPLLLKKKSDANLIIAGANPSKDIQRLKNEHIHVTGWVDDMRECFSQSRIHLAPMLISIGLQNKILQAMAMKVPCIVSSLANNAIHAPVDDCVLIADTPQQYAEKILLLLNDEILYKRLSENAFRFVNQNFNWSSMVKKIEEVLFA